MVERLRRDRPAAALYATLDDWIASRAIPFSLDSPETVDAAVDTVVAALGDAVELLAFGEALHSGEARWLAGTDLHRWWPAGAHLARRLGARHAAVGAGVGVSADNDIGWPELGSLEVHLTALPDAAVLIPTRLRLPGVPRFHRLRARRLAAVRMRLASA